MGSYRDRWAHPPPPHLRHKGSSSPRLTNRGRKMAPALTGIFLSLSTRALRQHWQKRGRLYRKKRGGPGACRPPSAASACWTPTPFSLEGAGLCFPSGHPVAAENELGWAPRGSRFIVKRASHSLIEARVHAGKAQRSCREH